MLPLDDDVLTLAGSSGPADAAFASFAAGGDTSHLSAVTRALQKLQDVFGHIPHIRAKGPHARSVVDALVRARRDEAAEAGGGAAVSGSNGVPAAGSTDARTVSVVLPAAPLGGGVRGAVEISAAVILDRSVDAVTPLLTPLTFEALLDEVMCGSSPAHTAVEGTVTQPATRPDGRPLPPFVAGSPPAAAALWNGTGIAYAMGAVDASLVVDDGDGDAAAAAGKAARPAPPPPPPGTRVAVHFNSNDRLFADLRGANVEAAGAVLAARARELAALQESIIGKKATSGGGGKGDAVSVADIRKLVKAIPGLQADKRSLRIAVALMEGVKAAANDPRFVARWQLERAALDEENLREALEVASALAANRAPLLRPLRLACLIAAIEGGGGLRSRALESLRRDLVAAYGFPRVIRALHALDASGLLTTRDGGGLGAGLVGGGSSWSTLRRVFRLTAAEVDPSDPADIHFVTSGYAPLSVRLVQAAIAPTYAAFTTLPGAVDGPAQQPAGDCDVSSWDAAPVSDALRLIPGPAVHLVQRVAGAAAQEVAAAGRRTTVLVVFIGGVAAIEIAALRWLSERSNVDYVTFSSGGIVSGHRLVASMVNPLENGMAGEAGGADDGDGDEARDDKDDDAPEAPPAALPATAAAAAAAGKGQGAAPKTSSSFFGRKS